MAIGKKTGGRKAGTPNKVTADIKALAQAHAEDVIKELARLAVRSESDAARVSAIKELLDRGYGKSRQPVDMDAKLDANVNLTKIERAIVNAQN